ncbi:TetR/AcrR family transcriptional regulator [Kutzneria kofuensis]|uniref:AcrR family transcriptional regulator n=1 Tax=Kutzneria kofuensis TaxID=103725 RepID=A0A7W9NJD6_9PSEU|nr:TetR/AcrR family transcriptional regulator [Kutzneria kofuensis]MBB5895537.1 AcrR family transcriptional regulator [Kutzneria kofuensis]
MAGMVEQADVLAAAETLFYERGVQQVGMDQVRAAAGVSLKRLYQLFPSKDQLVLDYLAARDERWLASVREHALRAGNVLAVFDWLAEWFAEPDFRGCAFVNSFGELGGTSAAVADVARRHKEAFRQLIRDLVGDDELGDQITLLAEGAITMAAIGGSVEPARQARRAAEALLTLLDRPHQHGGLQ